MSNPTAPHTLATDLFGNPIDDAPAPPAPAGPVAAREPVNDMDRVQAVLTAIADDTADVLHVDQAGRVRCCTGRDTKPAPADLAAVVAQLIDAQYLTTHQRSCPGHGSVVTTTRAGRHAVCRWRAYRRPTTWPTQDTTDAGNS